MYIIKLKILGARVREEEVIECVDLYLTGLFQRNQLVNTENLYEKIKGGISVTLLCVEKDSYQDKYSSTSTLNSKRQLLEEYQCKLEFENCGVDQELGKTKISKKPTMYILTGQHFGASPITSIEKNNDNLPLPFYKILPIHDLESKDFSYYNLFCWMRNYNRVWSLWFSGLDDDWTLNQLENYKSSLGKEGRKCAKAIEKVTNIPTYYWLFNYQPIFQEQDKKRKCPKCGKKWYIEGKGRNDLYAFKCDSCRLVGAMTINSPD